MISHIRHTGIVVSDLEKSLKFYEDLLGFKVTKKNEEYGNAIDQVLGLKDARVTTVKMSAPDGNLIELLSFSTHPRRRKGTLEICDIGITHMAFTVSDIEKEYARLEKAGVEFNSPPQPSRDGYAKLAFCKDPDGNFVELVEVLKK